MTPKSYDRGVQRTWAAFEAFRRIGFSADDIHFGAGPVVPLGATSPRPGLACQLQSGDKTFTIITGTYTTQDEADAALESFQAFAEIQNAGGFDHEDLMDVYWTSLAEWGGSVALVKAILSKGMELPLRQGESS